MYPPVLITDVNKKCCFKLSMDSIHGLDIAKELVHQKDFWEQTRLQVLAAGHLDKSDNAIRPSYDFWAPYLGDARRDDEVFNTEYKKVAKCTESQASDESKLDLSEDLLLELMTEKKLSEIRKVCRSINVSDKGMKLECLSRIKKKISMTKYFNKVFTKFSGSSGGVLVACCPHGIVYGHKFLLGGESPRDHVDLILSLKHQPTIHVSDIPSFIARHGNKRKGHMYHPNEGRFDEASEENLRKAKEGKLLLNIPELNFPQLDVDTCLHDHDYTINRRHPVTGSDSHFAAFDRFHQENSSVEEDIMRRLDIVTQLQGFVNSQVVEELFNSLHRSQYFLTQMSPINHIFIVRLILHFQNKTKNEQYMERMQSALKTTLKGCSISFGPDRAVQITGVSTVTQPAAAKSPRTEALRSPVRVAQPAAAKSPRTEAPRSPVRVTQPAAKRQKSSKETFGVKPGSEWDIAQTAHPYVVLARHGPYPVTSTDFLSLSGKTWLTDQVIDAYLYMLSHERLEIVHLPTQTLTRILDGRLTTPHSILRKVKLSDFNSILGVFHQGGAHWTSVVINTKQKEMLYYDSYGEKPVIARALLKNWSMFWNGRKHGVQGNFRLSFPEKVPRQSDAHNCGVYALGFLHQEITGDALLMTSPMKSRSVIAQQLFDKSELQDIYCARCGKDSGELGTCVKCCSRFHLTCTSAEKRQQGICFTC